MGFKDVRSFLQKLDEEGQLIKYDQKVKLSPEWYDMVRALPRMGQYGPALITDKLEGYTGQRIAVGLQASAANCAIMLGLPKDTSLKDQIAHVSDLWDKIGDGSGGKLKWVDKAPSQEVIVEGDDLNLLELLPLHRVYPLDGGFYLPKSCIVTKSPYYPDDVDRENVGWYRCQVVGPREIAIHIGPLHDAGEHIGQAAELKQNLPIAICLGNDPLLELMSSTSLRKNESEYKFAAAMGDFEYELTKATLYDLDVPANSEFIIEGEILPDCKVPEGPFGEFPGTYSGVSEACKMVVKRVTHRVDPIYVGICLAGISEKESENILALNTSSGLFRLLKSEMPDVKAVNAMYQHGMTTIVSAKPHCPSFAKTIAMRLASTPHGTDYCRNIIIVDDEVDPFNLNEVMWALSTRVRGSEDIIVIPGTPGLPLLPADLGVRIGRKLIIDATTPIDPDPFRPSKLIRPYSESVDLREKIAALQRELKK